MYTTDNHDIAEILLTWC